MSLSHHCGGVLVHSSLQSCFNSATLEGFLGMINLFKVMPQHLKWIKVWTLTGPLIRSLACCRTQVCLSLGHKLMAGYSSSQFSARVFILAHENTTTEQFIFKCCLLSVETDCACICTSVSVKAYESRELIVVVHSS